MPSSAARAEELAVAFLSRVWRGFANDLDAVDELMTEDYRIHSGGTTIAGREQFKEWVASFQRILFDAKNDILAVFANEAGDMVVARWRCMGRNNGIFGLAPDGRDVSFTGIAIWRVQDGRLAECWVERAALEAYRALASPIDQA
jgi:predicted ester cyclase